MSQLTDRGPSLSSRGRASAQRSSMMGTAFLGGAVAAGLGLGALAVVVLLLWVASPYPDDGPSRALHLAADLWLLAHGGDLVRTVTLSGEPAPVGVTPLLLSALPVWLLYRAARHALAPAPGPATLFPLAGTTHWPMPRAVLGWLLTGYLLVATAAVLYASEGPMHAAPLSALLHVPVLVVCTLAAAARRTLGPEAYAIVPAPLRRAWSELPPGVRSVCERRRFAAALRAAAAATVVLLVSGALLTALAIGWHAGAVGTAFLELAPDWSGRLTVLLLSLALLPNAVIWGTAYALGPGFTVGAGSTIGPLGVAGYPVLPHFPLLGALPQEGEGTPLTWAVAIAPVAAGLALARYASRHDSGWRDTVTTTVLAAALCGLTTAMLAAFSGGPLGTTDLSTFGPTPWLTGLTTTAWTTLIALPTALTLRTWRLRTSPPTPAHSPSAEPDTPSTTSDTPPATDRGPSAFGHSPSAHRPVPDRPSSPPRPAAPGPHPGLRESEPEPEPGLVQPAPDRTSQEGPQSPPRPAAPGSHPNLRESEPEPEPGLVQPAPDRTSQEGPQSPPRPAAPGPHPNLRESEPEPEPGLVQPAPHRAPHEGPHPPASSSGGTRREEAYGEAGGAVYGGRADVAREAERAERYEEMRTAYYGAEPRAVHGAESGALRGAEPGAVRGSESGVTSEVGIGGLSAEVGEVLAEGAAGEGQGRGERGTGREARRVGRWGLLSRKGRKQRLGRGAGAYDPDPYGLDPHEPEEGEPDPYGSDPYGLEMDDADSGRDPWHDAGAREARWAALREFSGGLMPEFTPDPSRGTGENQGEDGGENGGENESGGGRRGRGE